MAKTAENPSENDHGDEENDRIPISMVSEATSDSEWHPATEETVLLLPEATFCDDYESSHDGALSNEKRALFAGGSLIALPYSTSLLSPQKGHFAGLHAFLCPLAGLPAHITVGHVRFVMHVCLSFAEFVIQGLTCCLLPNNSSRQL